MHSIEIARQMPTPQRFAGRRPASLTRIPGLRAILISTASLLATLASGQAVLPIDSVLGIIERRNPMLLEYDSKVRALDVYAEGATSLMAPMVGAGTFMTPYASQMLMEERDKGAWMFSVEQEIQNPGKLRANRNYLRSRANAAKQERKVRFNALRAEARTYYYEWIVAEKKLAVLAQNTEILELMLKLERIRYPLNQGNLGNIYKTEGRLAEVANMILMTQGEIEDRKSRLRGLMNAPQLDFRIDSLATIDFEALQIAEDTLSLVYQRSDIRRIDETIETMRLNQQAQRASAKPDFRLRFDHMQPIGNMPTQFTAMAMVSIPIAPWSSKMYKSEIRGMQYDIEAMNSEKAAVLAEARAMLAGMAGQITRMKKQLDNYETRILPALQKNYDATMIAYEENRAQLPAVIDAWEAHNMAQMDYLEKLEEYYLMIIAYDKEAEK